MITATIHQRAFPDSRLDVMDPAGRWIRILARLDLSPESAQRLAALQPQVAILDLREQPLAMAGALLDACSAVSPQPRILVVGSPADDEMAALCLAAGASAYLSRDHGATALTRAVQDIVRGGWHMGATGKRAVATLVRHHMAS